LTKTGTLIKFDANLEGVATLWVSADSLTDDTSGVTGIYGEYQLYYGRSEAGDSLWGQWTAFEDSVVLYTDVGLQYDSNSMVGRETDLGNVWMLARGVRFRFTNPGDTKFMTGFLYYY